jgi:long-chain acyl-CoA synthetase
MTHRTMFQVLEQAAARYGDAAALHQPYTHASQRSYRTWSWNDYKVAAEEIAAGLRRLGVAAGDVVAIDSETRAELYLADLGIMTNGSISACMYPSYPAAELVRTIGNCDAKAVFVEDAATLKALKDAPVGRWILLTGEAEGAMTLEELRALGRQAIQSDPEFLPRIHAEVKPSDYAILYLTSGATGEPKMVLVTHEAIVTNLEMGPKVLPLTAEDSTVAYLPSAHIAQRIVIGLLPILSGTPVWFAESLMKLPQEIRSVRPTLFLAPPRLWERTYSTICTEIRKRPAPVRRLFYGALGLGLEAARLRRQGKSVPPHVRVPLKLADRVFFRKIRAKFGGRLRVPASGAAPLSKDLAEFYEAIGMPLIEGYGITEGGIVSLNPLAAPRPGSIGKALPGVEVRLGEDGELLIRSDAMMSGYHKDPATTAEVLEDGWLHTGDIGRIDESGFLFITGRKKEVIVSSTGKKIFPARIESLFKLEPLFSQVLLVGDRLPHLTALFTLNRPAAETLKGMDGYQGRSDAEVAAAPPVVAEVQKAVSRVNRQLAPFEQIRKHRILQRDFSIEAGELTATMKVRRARVMQNFQQEIEELYAR